MLLEGGDYIPVGDSNIDQNTMLQKETNNEKALYVPACDTKLYC